MSKTIYVEKGDYLAIIRNGKLLAVRNDLTVALAMNAYGMNTTIINVGKKNPAAGMIKPAIDENGVIYESVTPTEKKRRHDEITQAMIADWCYSQGESEAKFLRRGLLDITDSEFVRYNKAVKEIIAKRQTEDK